MSLIFADHYKLVAAASKLARAQAEFDAVVAKVNKIMLPLHHAVEDANNEFKQVAMACAKDEADKIFETLDLNVMLEAAEAQEEADKRAAKIEIANALQAAQQPAELSTAETVKI